MNRFGRQLLGVMAGVLLSVTAYAEEQKPLIVVDQGHDQRFVIEEKGELQLSRFAESMRAAGAAVTSYKTPISEATLKDARALVISGPFQELKADEIDAVARFVERGGRVAVMLHIGQTLSGLLNRLDVDHSNAVLHERANVIDTDNNFRVTNLTGSPLFAGISHFSMYGVWALDQGKAGTVLAQTSGEAWADLDGNRLLSRGDVIGAFNVVVTGTLGAGAFVVFGDDALFQNRYLDEQNARLAVNLTGWLLGR